MNARCDWCGTSHAEYVIFDVRAGSIGRCCIECSDQVEKTIEAAGTKSIALLFEPVYTI